MSATGVDPLIQIVATGLIAIVFARALLEKISNYGVYVGTLRDYRLTPDALAPAAAAALLAAEVLALVLLLHAPLRPIGALAAIALLTVYGLAMSLALAAGRTQIECGCGGEGQIVSWLLVARNSVLAAIAGVLPLPTEARNLGWFDLVGATCAVLVAWLVLASAEKAIENAAAIRRLETQSYL